MGITPPCCLVSIWRLYSHIFACQDVSSHQTLYLLCPSSRHLLPCIFQEQKRHFILLLIFLAPHICCWITCPSNWSSQTSWILKNSINLPFTLPFHIMNKATKTRPHTCARYLAVHYCFVLTVLQPIFNLPLLVASLIKINFLNKISRHYLKCSLQCIASRICLH